MGILQRLLNLFGFKKPKIINCIYPITYSPEAVLKMREILIEHNVLNQAHVLFRVGIGGPTGYFYQLGFEKNITSEMLTWENNGVKFAVFSNQLEVLVNASIIYGLKDGKDGFIINCPIIEDDELRKKYQH